MKRLAVARLHLSDGRILKNQVVDFADDNDKTILKFYPLTEELPFTEWHNADYCINENNELKRM